MRQTDTAPVEVPRLQGWEIQLAPIDTGHVLERQEFRDRWLGRCTWVTRQRPMWSDRLPWYEVALATEDHPDLVVDGVVRWELYDPKNRALGSRYVLEDPFRADVMVPAVLHGARWTEGVGWELDYATAQRRRGPREARRQSVRGIVAEYCNRTAKLPEFSRSWTETDWWRFAILAHDRRVRGEALTDLDRAAIARCPAPSLADPLYEASTPALYDSLRDTRPCIICGGIVVVSSSIEFPVHHRCAWYVARGETPPPPGTNAA